MIHRRLIGLAAVSFLMSAAGPSVVVGTLPATGPLVARTMPMQVMPAIYSQPVGMKSPVYPIRYYPYGYGLYRPWLYRPPYYAAYPYRTYGYAYRPYYASYAYPYATTGLMNPWLGYWGLGGSLGSWGGYPGAWPIVNGAALYGGWNATTGLPWMGLAGIYGPGGYGTGMFGPAMYGGLYGAGVPGGDPYALGMPTLGAAGCLPLADGMDFAGCYYW